MDEKEEQPVEGEVLTKKRSTKYEKWMCDRIIEVAEQGGHVPQMCHEIGVKSKDTFYRWVRENKEFGAAYDQAKLYSQAFYENLLLMGACGKIKNFNFNSVAMIMNNKFNDEYKRGATGGSNTEINIGSINSIDKLDEDALDEKIKKLQNKLGYTPTEEIENDEDNI